MSRWLAGLLILLTLAVAALFCVVILDEREQAFRTLLNEPNPEIFGVELNQANLVEPGWYLRIPFLHEFYRYERRNLHFHSAPHSLNTVDRTLVDLDYYVVWRIANPQLFFESNRGEAAALQRIDELSYSEVRETVNQHSLRDLLSDRRDAVEREISEGAASALEPLGVEVVDVRIGGTIDPEANMGRVHERMRTERSRFALKFRAEGEQQARGIRSQADAESQVILAEAERESLRLHGEGDAEAARTYADVYGADPEFYTFVRSLEAYRKSLDGETTLVLSRDSSFLRYLFDPRPPVPEKP